MSEDERWPQWGLGIAAPLGLGVWGLWALVTRAADLRSRNGVMHLEGWESVVFGLTLLFSALYLHFEQFWTRHEHEPRWETAASAASLVAAIVALIATVVAIVRHFVV